MLSYLFRRRLFVKDVTTVLALVFLRRIPLAEHVEPVKKNTHTQQGLHSVLRMWKKIIKYRTQSQQSRRHTGAKTAAATAAVAKSSNSSSNSSSNGNSNSNNNDSDSDITDRFLSKAVQTTIGSGILVLPISSAVLDLVSLAINIWVSILAVPCLQRRNTTTNVKTKR